MADTPDSSVPSWLQTPQTVEARWPAVVAIAAAMALQWAIPERYTVGIRWPLLGLELLLLVFLLVTHSKAVSADGLVDRWATIARRTSLTLTAAITVANTLSAGILDYRILAGEVSNDPAKLLGSGAAIFITNVIAFGVWYWELDRGGPFARHRVATIYPDFLFPQMTQDDIAKDGWRPEFVDYLYVSFTNSVAFSPTDTMPLSRWAKLMMTVQAIVATSTLALVIARAVNVLG
jgi:hypothetical protein